MEVAGQGLPLEYLYRLPLSENIAELVGSILLVEAQATILSRPLSSHS